MLVSKYEDTAEQHANGSDKSSTRSTAEGDWVDPAQSLPAIEEPGNTLGGWL